MSFTTLYNKIVTCRYPESSAAFKFRLGTTINDKKVLRPDPSKAQSAPEQEDFLQDEFEGSLDQLGAGPDYRNHVVPRGVKMRRRHMGSSDSLPVITLEPRVHHTFRYARETGTTSNTFNVTVGDVARVLVAAATANTYRYIMRTFRLKKVVVRGSNAAIGDDVTVTLRYLGQNTNEIIYQDTTLKIDENACVQRAPPRFSLASFWHDVENDNLDTELFQVSYSGSSNGQCYVDLHLEYLIDVNRYVSFTLSGGTGLNLGAIYKGSLSDGLDPVGGARLQ